MTSVSTGIYFMRIAILTFEGFNEIDSFVALNLLGRVRRPNWQAHIASPTETVQSVNGLRIHAQQPLEYANEADVVLIGSGRYTRSIIEDRTLMSRLQLNPSKQLIGSQCSGALMLAKLGLLDSMPACTDSRTKPFLAATNVTVLQKPFHCEGNIATAGGCLSAHYLATWVITRALGREAAEEALRYIVPVGEEQQYIARAMSVVGAA
ncbi:MAG TPA: DJ-1/PfpI family protein [Steroidobacteraceae bacterium]|nr:DJ-1/PfpI family protein [Steroidobacteraceae bacterium]